MKTKLDNLTFSENGNETIAKAKFMDHHIEVQCFYDSESRYWVCQVYLADDTGLQRLTEIHSALLSSSRWGAVYRGLHLQNMQFQNFGWQRAFLTKRKAQQRLKELPKYCESLPQN